MTTSWKHYNSGITQDLSTRDTTLFPQNHTVTWLLSNVKGKFEQNQKHTEPIPSCQPHSLFEEKKITYLGLYFSFYNKVVGS